jgi:hypothetical protein
MKKKLFSEPSCFIYYLLLIIFTINFQFNKDVAERKNLFAR